ncbi:MAG: septum site-determining protein MinC [Firmicutes bacterium]|nr:septum site-determining protein MinC [Bacillota bacterium]
MLWLDPHAEFDDVFNQLQEKLAVSKDFWQGVTVVLKQTERECCPKEKAQLEKLMGEFGMALKEHVADNPSSRMKTTREVDRDYALIVRRTLRSGQRVHHEGSVVVLGDVNPGAEVVAGGDIVVLGTLRGIAHAGALGEETAVVMALKLLPTQLRIAHFISRAPDHQDAPEPQGPEIARIRNNLITIHSYGP